MMSRDSMRRVVVVVAAGVILAYAVAGGLMMTRWEVTAASGLPLAETITQMEAAGESYTAATGIVFAVFGGLLALGWGVFFWRARNRSACWLAAVSWGGIMALGAPAYFFASFANMNSVGDTFADWDMEAASAVVSPLFTASGVGLAVAVIGCAVGLVHAIAEGRRDRFTRR